METRAYVQCQLTGVSFQAKERKKWWTVTWVKWNASPLFVTLECTAYRKGWFAHNKTLYIKMGHFANETSAPLEVIQAITKLNLEALEFMRKP